MIGPTGQALSSIGIVGFGTVGSGPIGQHKVMLELAVRVDIEPFLYGSCGYYLFYIR